LSEKLRNEAGKNQERGRVQSATKKSGAQEENKFATSNYHFEWSR